MNEKDLKKGEKGEEFFQYYSSPALFYSEIKEANPNEWEYVKLSDQRSSRKEGEFILNDGSLIEVKTDRHCFQTGNIIVELSGRNGDVGWFQHCKENGVRYIVWELFRDESHQLPYCTVLFDFDRFAQYIDSLIQSDGYCSKNIIIKVDHDGSVFKILKVNLCDAFRHCDPKIAYTHTLKTLPLHISNDYLASIDSFLSKDVGLADYSWNPEDCIILSVYRYSDILGD